MRSMLLRSWWKLKRKTKKMKRGEPEFWSKKAIAPIVSFVLLIGLAVALGTGVYLWQVKQTEGISSGVVRYVSGVMECNEINFNVYTSCINFYRGS